MSKTRQTYQCQKCGIEFVRCGIQECPHEAVNAVYGKYICRYCCMKCKHNIITDIGQECELRKEKDNV